MLHEYLFNNNWGDCGFISVKKPPGSAGYLTKASPTIS